MDFWDLKRHFELAIAAAAPGVAVDAGKDGVLWAAVAPDGREVGRARVLEADTPKWGGQVLGFEVEITVGSAPTVTYVPLPTQPATAQDLSLVVPGGVLAAEVEQVLRESSGPLLVRLEVLDEYRGPKLPEGSRGVTWRCVFRDPARTLRDSDVDEVIRRALTALEAKLGVRRRTG
jgi:phenylalanyl-tRNA synthetase beta chain